MHLHSLVCPCFRPELMHYPVFTVPCCLAGVVPNGLTWDPAATKLVQEHAKAGQDMPLSAVISSYVETENGKLAAVTLSAEVWRTRTLIATIYLSLCRDNRSMLSLLRQGWLSNSRSGVQQIGSVAYRFCFLDNASHSGVW